jgi:hypothetical protein
MIGIEPTWVTPLDPKSSASASFATSAFLQNVRFFLSMTYIAAKLSRLNLWNPEMLQGSAKVGVLIENRKTLSFNVNSFQ